MTKALSVCIPTYEMNGQGVAFLEHSFVILCEQTFKDFEVVISDHSKDNSIKKLCQKYDKILDIHYLKNVDKVGSSSANINNAIQHANGKLIKILFQDDFLFYQEALQDIVESFDLEKDHWLVTACEHSHDGITFYRPFFPRYNKNVYIGNNTISSPSVLTIKNENPLLFDTNLTWLMDCDYYRRYYDAYGKPKILNKINVVNRVGEHQVTNTIATEDLRQKEHKYMLNKFPRHTFKGFFFR